MQNSSWFSLLFVRLHRMCEMLTIVTDVQCSRCLSVSLSVTWLKSAAVRAVYAVCHVRGVIQYSLSQMPLVSCYDMWLGNRVDLFLQ